ncbi:hypothetical protein [Chromobacterium violaceum]|uniref:hypothetical protein n=1 Tax=Chromobacterium violaceum TaxID=536 RepID=UPI001CE079F7|nr:hypothetical protein [Chromobacterium violaceum]
MRIDIIEYDPETGRIQQTGNSPPENVAQAMRAGKSLIEGVADPLTQYVLNGRLAARPRNPARLEGLTLRDLPVPCEVVIDGRVYPCPDAECELSFGRAGQHEIWVQAWPVQEAYFEVTT